MLLVLTTVTTHSQQHAQAQHKLTNPSNIKPPHMTHVKIVKHWHPKISAASLTFAHMMFIDLA